MTFGYKKVENALALLAWLQTLSGPVLMGADANSPKVDHPDFAFMTRGGRTLIVNTPEGAGEYVHLVKTALIERAETPDSSLAS